MVSLDRLQEMYDAVHKKKTNKLEPDKSLMENAIGIGNVEVSPELKVLKDSQKKSEKGSLLKYMLLLFPLSIYASIRKHRVPTKK